MYKNGTWPHKVTYFAQNKIIFNDTFQNECISLHVLNLFFDEESVSRFSYNARFVAKSEDNRIRGDTAKVCLIRYITCVSTIHALYLQIIRPICKCFVLLNYDF